MPHALRLIRVVSLAVAAFALVPSADARAKGHRAGTPRPAPARRPEAHRPPQAPRASRAPARRPAAPRNHNVRSARQPVYRGGAPRTTPGPNFASSVASLRATLGVLARSGLDYQGHRTAAMHDVGSAILHLAPAGSGAATPNPALAYTANVMGVGSGPKATTTAATSDGYLRQAQTSLRTVALHLSTGSAQARQGRALASVRKAIKELETALALKT